MPVRLNGSTSGYVELTAPAIAGATSLELPTDSIKPGLVLVAAQSFSAVSSVSVNNCFTSTYANYRITLRITPSVSDTLLLQRVRASGTDHTTAVYYWKYFNAYSNTGTTGAFANLDTNARVGVTGASASSLIFSSDVFGPQTATQTHGLATLSGYDLSVSTPFFAITSFIVDNSIQYDGFTIYPASGTITGTVRVYGYRN